MPAKRCPMCHQANEERDWQCRRCGYEFGQPVAKTIELLRDQMVTARITFWLLVVICLLLFGVPLYLVFTGTPMTFLPGILGWTFLLTMTIRAGTKIRVSKESIVALENKPAPLPKATLQ
jgi:hypothetical protein